MFVTKLLTSPASELACRMIFAEIQDKPQRRTKAMATRDRAAFHNTLRNDVRDLGTDPPMTIELLQSTMRLGKGKLRGILQNLCRKCTGRSSTRTIPCPEVNCNQKVLTQKDLVRHVQLAHIHEATRLLAAMRTRRLQANQRDERAMQHQCIIPGYNRGYETAGGLRQHVIRLH